MLLQYSVNNYIATEKRCILTIVAKYFPGGSICICANRQGWWKLSQPDQANGSYVANNIKRTTAKFIHLVTIEKVLLAAAISVMNSISYLFPPLILFFVLYTLDLLPQYLLFGNGTQVFILQLLQPTHRLNNKIIDVPYILKYVVLYGFHESVYFQVLSGNLPQHASMIRDQQTYMGVFCFIFNANYIQYYLWILLKLK